MQESGFPGFRHQQDRGTVQDVGKGAYAVFKLNLQKVLSRRYHAKKGVMNMFRVRVWRGIHSNVSFIVIYLKV